MFEFLKNIAILYIFVYIWSFKNMIAMRSLKMLKYVIHFWELQWTPIHSLWHYGYLGGFLAVT